MPPGSSLGTRQGLALAELHGRVRLRIVACEATFAQPAAGRGPVQHPTQVEIRAPGAVLGGGEGVDLRVVGPAAEKVSRTHALLEPRLTGWRVADLRSRNGTWELTEDGEWARLPTDLAIPLSDGARLALGPKLLLVVELLPSEDTGEETPGHRGGPGRDALPDRVRPRDLEQFAILLLADRRIDPRKPTRSVRRVGKDLSLERAAAYTRLSRLMQIPQIAASAPSGKAEDIADALALHFPYLVGD
jgi:hypothetical protein